MTPKTIIDRVVAALLPADAAEEINGERTGARDAEADALVEAFLRETPERQTWGLKVKEYPSGGALLDAAPDLQVAAVKAVFARMQRPATPWDVKARVRQLLTPLFTRNLPYTAGDLEFLLGAATNDGHYYGDWGGVLRHVRRYKETQGLTPAMRASLEQLYGKVERVASADYRKIRSQLLEVLGRADAGLPDGGDPWAEAARSHLQAMPPDRRAAWVQVLAHAEASEAARPSAKWNASAKGHVETLGAPAFFEQISDWMRRVSLPQQVTRNEYGYVIAGVSDKNVSLLKGLAWYGALCEGAAVPETARALGHLAEAAFRKIPAHGPWAPRAGNAAIQALGALPGGAGVAQLAALRARLRDRSALKLIGQAIEQAARAAGVGADDLEDLAVPACGLDGRGRRRDEYDRDGAAELTVAPATGHVALAWFGGDGKPRKAVPAAVRQNHAAAVKEIKAAEEEARKTLAAQAARFDRFLGEERTWTWAQWRERYLGHPLLGNLARRLLWTATEGDRAETFLPGDVLPGGFSDAAAVRLWHPLGSSVEAVLRWRREMEDRGVVQPFKQAHREVYLLTDAERSTRTYSNRFAGHILKQHQFNSLCALRGWKNKLRLMVDDCYPPATLEIQRHDLRAEFWVEGIGENYGTDTNETGTYLRLTTDQVRFYRRDAAANLAHAGGGGYGAAWRTAPAEPVPLEDVPALAFSEVMRDVDLFVGVASVGNDPAWSDGGPDGRFRNYWHDVSFGDLGASAQTRADVLSRLLPRLKIRDRCALEGRFLVVRGDLRTYKIHLGSGNILMGPDDQYLCIVQDRRQDGDAPGVFLPFEGDARLSLILSKAFLLAADTRITDETILRQIRPR